MFPGVSFHHEKFALLCCRRLYYMKMLNFLRVFNTQICSLGAVNWTNHKNFADGHACSLCMHNGEGNISKRETRDTVNSFITKAGPAYSVDSVSD